MPLRPLHEVPVEVCARIATVFTDIDDTLTIRGRVRARAFSAIWQAYEAGLEIVLVTGRPAGWCDHLARMWPVAAVVGENGALCFAMQGDRMRRLYAPREEEAARRLDLIRREVLEQVPGCKVSADQAYREYDLAVDFCEEVEPLGDADVDRIVRIFEAHGATAKVSSIHVNGWFGSFDKLTMCMRCSSEILGRTLDPERCTFIGDSPNDVPMFRHFPHAVGVANVRRWTQRMEFFPTYVTDAEGGDGFAEAIETILARRTGATGSSRP